VPEEGCEVSAQTEAEILNICREVLPAYMVPECVEFRTELPHTERGKVDYRALERESAEQ